MGEIYELLRGGFITNTHVSAVVKSSDAKMLVTKAYTMPGFYYTIQPRWKSALYQDEENIVTEYMFKGPEELNAPWKNGEIILGGVIKAQLECVESIRKILLENGLLIEMLGITAVDDFDVVYLGVYIPRMLLEKGISRGNWLARVDVVRSYSKYNQSIAESALMQNYFIHSIDPMACETYHSFMPTWDFAYRAITKCTNKHLCCKGSFSVYDLSYGTGACEQLGEILRILGYHVTIVNDELTREKRFKYFTT